MKTTGGRTPQKNVLGKGLASLFPNSATPATAVPTAAPAAASAPSVKTPESAKAQELNPSPAGMTGRDVYMGISMVNIHEIQTNQHQPRKDFDEKAIQELSQSIKISGIIQPLVVRKNSKDGFELIAGERRLRAAKLAGLKQVPIVIRRSTDREMLELALVENIQREDLNCVDEALAYFQLIEDFSLKQEEVADRVGKDRATVANYLRLLRLPQTILDDLRKQLLTFGHGKALLGLDDHESRMKARAQILENKLSVRDTEALVEAIKNTAKAGGEGQDSAGEPLPPLKAVAQRMMNLSRELARYWAAKVEIKGNEKRGKIVIHYSSRADLERILQGMQAEKK